jgi:hypothetical protein
MAYDCRVQFAVLLVSLVEHLTGVSGSAVLPVDHAMFGYFSRTVQEDNGLRFAELGGRIGRLDDCKRVPSNGHSTYSLLELQHLLSLSGESINDDGASVLA